MEYHRDDRYLSEIEVLLVLDKGPADAQFHEGHSQGLVSRARRIFPVGGASGEKYVWAL